MLSAAFVSAAASDVCADIDLTGRWRESAGVYVDIVQSGSDVTVLHGADTYTGTFNQTTLAASASPRALSMRIYDDGAILDGVGFVSGSISGWHLRFTRCECYDGDEAGGDGCDAECLVEPCFTCTPEPSVCTPSADAAPCDDRNDCTIDETCSSGECGGGTDASPCVNLTGDWQVFESTESFGGYRAEIHESYTQRRGVVTTSSSIGSVDIVTGAMELVTRGNHLLCGPASVVDATASLDNRSFTGTGVVAAPGIPPRCNSVDKTVAGRRCDPDAGCDLQDCSGYPEGTPCEDGDTCTIGEACQNGLCRGIPKCPACESCTPEGGCDEIPMPSCLRTADESSSRLQLATEGANRVERINWSWTRGEALDADALNPAAADFTLCIFGADDRILYQTELSSEANCPKPPCWKGGDGSWAYRNHEDATPITSLSLKSGTDGRSRVKLKAKGPLLNDPLSELTTPQIPLALPFTTQLQSSTGGCFEAEFDEIGTSRNADGKFKATGGALP